MSGEERLTVRFERLEGGEDGEASPGDGHAVHIAAADVEPLRAVLDGIAECYSGGAPWPPLTDAERVAVERLISALSG